MGGNGLPSLGDELIQLNRAQKDSFAANSIVLLELAVDVIVPTVVGLLIDDDGVEKLA